MDLTISEETLRSAHITAEELKKEIAVLLFAQERLTLSQAAQMSEMSPFAFQHLLSSREIGPHYDEEAFEEDLEVLRQQGDD